MPGPTLLLLINDYISEFIAKGEVIDRYYNPGNLFGTLHFLLVNRDQPDMAALQRMAGNARIHVHHLPAPRFSRSLGWRPWLLRGWSQQGVQLAREIQPDLIRAHGNFANGYLAAAIRCDLGVPLVVSLHTEPDTDLRGRTPWWPSWNLRLAHEQLRLFERTTLQTADVVLPVYEPIRAYAERLGARRVEVRYNMLNIARLRQKTSYSLHSPARILSVGRQFAQKNPDNLIRAVARLDNVHLTLVGDGPYHQRLRSLVDHLGVGEQVTFRSSVPNDELCQSLPDFDLFATHTEYFEIGKAVLEPLLTGVPVILNRRAGVPVPELQGDWVHLVPSTEDGYYQALDWLLHDDVAREALGRRAFAHAAERYAPERTEAAFVQIYQDLLRRPALSRQTNL